MVMMAASWSMVTMAGSKEVQPSAGGFMDVCVDRAGEDLFRLNRALAAHIREAQSWADESSLTWKGEQIYVGINVHIDTMDAAIQSGCVS